LKNCLRESVDTNTFPKRNPGGSAWAMDDPRGNERFRWEARRGEMNTPRLRTDRERSLLDSLHQATRSNTALDACDAGLSDRLPSAARVDGERWRPRQFWEAGHLNVRRACNALY
jgi:hypothetical protein